MKSLRYLLDLLLGVWRWWVSALGLITVPFLPLLLGTTTGMNDDVVDIHLPTTAWAWDTLLSGQLPTWGNWAFAGSNVAGFGQAGSYYPLNAVFALFDPAAMWRWWVLAHLWIAATGAFFWAYRSWRSAPGAAVAAVAYGLNGFTLLHLVHMPLVVVAAWLPWFFLGIDLVGSRWTLRRSLVLVLSTATIATAGLAQFLWLALTGAGLYAAVQYARLRTGLRPLIRIGGGIAVGLAIAALHLVPHYLHSRTSVRQELSFGAAMADSARPRDLLTSVVPYVTGGGSGVPGFSAPWQGQMHLHEMANHTGILVVALAVLAVVLRWRNRQVLALAAVATFGLLTAVGDATPLGRWIYDFVPLADRFRIWSRHMLLFNLATACLAGLGALAILTDVPFAQRRRWIVGLCALPAAAVLLMPLATNLGGTRVTGGTLATILGFVLVCLTLLALAVHLGGRWPRRSAALILGAVAFNMAIPAVASPWNGEAVPRDQVRAHFRGELPPNAQPYEAAGGVSRWMTNAFTLRGTAPLAGTQLVNGYDPMAQADFARLTGGAWWGGFTGDQMWSSGWHADVLRSTTFFAWPGTDITQSGWRFEGTLPNSPVQRWVREPRLPEAYVVGAVGFYTLDSIDRRLRDEQARFDLVAYLDLDSPHRDAFAGRSELGPAGRVVEGAMGEHGRGRFVVEADRPGVLVISSGWLDGWSASVNGAAVPVVRANGLVLAVPVEPGRNEVKLSYSPPGFRLGALLTFAALIVYLGTAVISKPTRRRPRVR